MAWIKVFDVQRAIKKGNLEAFVNDGIIYLNDCQSGDCVKIGSVKGDTDDKTEEALHDNNEGRSGASSYR